MPASPLNVSGRRPEREPEPRDLGQSARDDGGGGVVAKTKSVGDANANRDHVLVGAAQFNANDVFVCVGPEIARRCGRGDSFGGFERRRGNDGRRWLPRGDFTREVGSRDDGHAFVSNAQHFLEHLRHAQVRAALDALHERDHHRVGWDERGKLGDDLASALRGNGDGDDVGVVERLFGVRRRGDAGRNGEPRQRALIAAVRRNVGEHVRVTSPQRGLRAGIGEHRREGGAPRSGTNDGGARHASS